MGVKLLRIIHTIDSEEKANYAGEANINSQIGGDCRSRQNAKEAKNCEKSGSTRNRFAVRQFGSSSARSDAIQSCEAQKEKTVSAHAKGSFDVKGTATCRR